MALQSALLSGNPRLEEAAAGGPSVKKRPPNDDPSAVKAIQRALVELGHKLPNSFSSGEPDGLFGEETFNRVMDYQKKVFPGQWQEWDGRVGKKTLEKMDAELPRGEEPGMSVAGVFIRVQTTCLDTGEAVAAVSAAVTQPLGSLRPAVAALGLPGRTT